MGAQGSGRCGKVRGPAGPRDAHLRTPLCPVPPLFRSYGGGRGGGVGSAPCSRGRGLAGLPGPGAHPGQRQGQAVPRTGVRAGDGQFREYPPPPPPEEAGKRQARQAGLRSTAKLMLASQMSWKFKSSPGGCDKREKEAKNGTAGHQHYVYPSVKNTSISPTAKHPHGTSASRAALSRCPIPSSRPSFPNRPRPSCAAGLCARGAGGTTHTAVNPEPHTFSGTGQLSWRSRSLAPHPSRRQSQVQQGW